jgi:hypothetical protein
VDQDTVEALMSAGVFAYDDIIEYGVEGLTTTVGLEPSLAERVYQAAQAIASGEVLPAKEAVVSPLPAEESPEQPVSSE